MAKLPMDRLINLFAVLVLSSLLMNACREGSAQTEKADIAVNSVKCEMCVKNVEKAVKRVEGVRDVSVDLDTKTASVVFEIGVTTVPGIEKAIAAAGYNAGTMERDSAAYHDLPSCCQ